MRILVVNSFFAPRTTGSAHFSEDIAHQFVRDGNEVVVLTTSYRDAAPDEIVDGYRIVRLPERSISPGAISFNYAIPFAFGWRNIRRIRQLFDEFRPDVIHQNGQFFDLTFLTTRLAAKRGIPRVITVHTALVHDRPVFLRFIRFIDRTLIRRLNRKGAPTWVSVDKRIHEYIDDVYRPPRDQHVFIPVGLEVDRFSGGDRDRVREEWGLGCSPVILSFGHVIPLRNRLALIGALPLLRDRYPNIKVMIVGQVYTSEFAELADKLGVADSVVVVGRIEHDEVRHFIAAADVETHDLQGIGLGITSLEVMAAGVPVVALVPPDNYPGVDLGRWPELLFIDRDEPELVAGSIIRLLEDRVVRNRVIVDQRRFVRELFGLGAVGSAYADVFERLTGIARPLSPRPVVSSALALDVERSSPASTAAQPANR